MAKTNSSILEWGRAVLLQESAALTSASESLGDSFVKAVELMSSQQGKVVVTGLGKSGHIARKIAATLSSTGTSAFYLHPSEALHGDSGMMQSNDCLLTVAFSGETAEVISLIEMAKRIDMSVISVTGKLDSSIAQISDVVLDGSIDSEADPLNIVPTSSSTVALALGDALSVALMRGRGFSETDFAKLHPGGSLGKSLAHVEEYLRIPQTLSVDMSSDFITVLNKVTEENFGIVGVKDSGGQLIGAITDGDLRRAIIDFGEKVFARNAEQLMSTNPKKVSSKALVVEAVNMMERHKITTLYVYDNNQISQILGLIRMHDLISAKFI